MNHRIAPIMIATHRSVWMYSWSIVAKDFKPSLPRIAPTVQRVLPHISSYVQVLVLVPHQGVAFVA